MATAANITVNNYAASPVTYKVLSVEPTKVIFADDSAGTLNGYRLIEIQRKLPVDKVNGVIRIYVKISRPTLDGVTGLVSYTCLGTQEYSFPAMATLAERREVYTANKNFAGHAVVLAAIETFETPY